MKEGAGLLPHVSRAHKPAHLLGPTAPPPTHVLGLPAGQRHLPGALSRAFVQGVKIVHEQVSQWLEVMQHRKIGLWEPCREHRVLRPFSPPRGERVRGESSGHSRGGSRCERMWWRVVGLGRVREANDPVVQAPLRAGGALCGTRGAPPPSIFGACLPVVRGWVAAA